MGIDMTMLLCLFIIVIVGLGSFGLGRLSALSERQEKGLTLDNKNTSVVKEEIGKSEIDLNNVKNTSFLNKEKMYVASKNGKLYYRPDCSGAKRILSKNEIWFASTSEAESAGYKLSTSCK